MAKTKIKNSRFLLFFFLLLKRGPDGVQMGVPGFVLAHNNYHNFLYYCPYCRTTLMMLTTVTMVTVLLFIDIQRCRSGLKLLGSGRTCDGVRNQMIIFVFSLLNSIFHLIPSIVLFFCDVLSI